MKSWLKIDLSAVGFSVLLHVIILGIMAFIQLKGFIEDPALLIESIINETREQQEFSQEMEIDNTVAETDNSTLGGKLADTMGSTKKMVAAKQKIETSEKLINPKVKVNAGNMVVLGDGALDENLGVLEIAGETGAIVEGYGAAMERLTQELLRLMRDDKLLVIWLFDASGSLKDDQKTIAEKFGKVYTELGIVQKKELEKKKKKSTARLRPIDQSLLTLVMSYGEKTTLLTPRPTADIDTIRSSIKNIVPDKSGKENMCTAIIQSVDTYLTLASRQKRRMVFVVVTDESGDDGDLLEAAIEKTRKMRAPVYVLGREAIFGYLYAHVRWKDPYYGRTHWIRVNRGPETAFVESMQWDGIRSRYDAYTSGFGPYEQVRLAKESGGIFFLLPGDESNLVGAGANEKRKFEFLDMKEYQPLLLPRREYAESRVRSKNFRSKIWDIIVTLNPNNDGRLPHYDANLNMRERLFPGDMQQFIKESRIQVKKAGRAMQLLNQAIAILYSSEPFRAQEESSRWRANYDLLRAQCFAYRVRLFQYLLAMDQLVNENRKFKNPKSNRWNLYRTHKFIMPDEAQYKRLKSAFNLKISREQFLKEMDDQKQTATDYFRQVIVEHPGTPWARRSSVEMRAGYGFAFSEYFYRVPKGGGGKPGPKVVIPKF